jgi:hypothetical protein
VEGFNLVKENVRQRGLLDVILNGSRSTQPDTTGRRSGTREIQGEGEEEEKRRRSLYKIQKRMCTVLSLMDRYHLTKSQRQDEKRGWGWVETAAPG